MSESRAGYQNHPLWKRCVFFSTFWLWNQWVWFFPYTTSTLKSLAIHTIWSALCDLFTNHTIFCTKSHLFLCQKKRNTKTAQPNRFQILLKVTNQISGQMDVKKRPCPGVGGSHVTHLTTSAVAVTVAIWPREVVSCHDFTLRTVTTFWARSLVGIYPGRPSIKWQLNFAILVWNHFCTPLSSITITNLWLLSIKLRCENMPPCCLITAIHKPKVKTKQYNHY